jgi:enoyl-CoA hydratase
MVGDGGHDQPPEQPSNQPSQQPSMVRRLDAGGGVAHVVLDRPHKRNALDAAGRRDLAAAITACGADDAVSVVVVRGEGPGFCSGADATTYDKGATTPWDDRKEMVEEGWGAFLAAWDAPVPVIVQVHGVCMGIASILCNFSDIVVVADDARIGWPKLPLGGGVISPTWVWHVGIHRAKELSYTIGSEISGTEAASIGFANRAVPADMLADEVDAMARRIARVPRDLLALKKQALNRVLDAQGFREAVLMGGMWGALSHELASTKAVHTVIAERGLRGAIDHFMGVDPDPPR